VDYRVCVQFLSLLCVQLLQQSGSGPNAGTLGNLGNLGLGESAGHLFNTFLDICYTYYVVFAL